MGRGIEVDITGNDASLQSAIIRSERRLHGLSKRSGAMAGALAGFGKRVTRTFGLIGIAAGGMAIKTAADFEQTRVAFEGILGNKGAAASLIHKLQQFAKYTPFQFTGLAKVSQQLLAVGFRADEIIPTLTTLGNQASILGQGQTQLEGVVRALGQMKGKGKASAEELRQISEQFPGFSAVNAIAKKLGITTGEVFKKMETGSIDAATGIEGILYGMKTFPGSAGAMIRQSKTLKGSMSNLIDTLQIAAIDVISPHLPAMSKGVREFGKLLTKTIVPAITKFGKALTDFFKANPDAKFAVLAGVVAGLVTIAVIGLAAALTALASPIVLIVAGVAALVAGIVYAYRHFEGFRNAVDAVARWLIQTAWPAVAAFAALVAAEFGKLVGWVRKNWGSISEAIKHYINAVKTVVGAVLFVIRAYWNQFGDRILKNARYIWNILYQVIKIGITLIGGIIKVVTALINGDWGKAWNAVKETFTRVWGGVVQIAKYLVGMVRNVVAGGIEAAVGLAKRYMNAFIDFWQALPGRIARAGSGLFNFVSSMFKGQINRVIDLWNALKFTTPSFEIFGKKTPSITVDTPNIPRMARGGVVDSPTLAVLGDAKGRMRREIATPEELLRDIVREEGGSGIRIEHWHAGTSGPDEIARSMAWLQRTRGLTVDASG